MRAFFLGTVLALSLGACSGGGPAGTYAPDFSAATEGLSPEQAKMMEAMKESMKMELTLKADNTFTVTGTVMGNKVNESGTWSLSGDQLTMKTLEEDGKKKATPEEAVVTYKDGTISKTEGGMKMVFKRK